MTYQTAPRFDTRDPIVTIEVGPDGGSNSTQTFRIHQGCLQKHSAWFNAKLKDEWKGRPDDVVRLRHYPPEAFALFAEWVYTEGTTRLVMDENGAVCEAWVTLAKAYVLGEELLSTAFQQEIGSHMHDKFSSWSGEKPVLADKLPELINIIYDGTAGDCSGRRWLVESAKLVWKAKDFKSRRSELPSDFVGDMIQSLWEEHDRKASSW